MTKGNNTGSSREPSEESFLGTWPPAASPSCVPFHTQWGRNTGGGQQSAFRQALQVILSGIPSLTSTALAQSPGSHLCFVLSLTALDSWWLARSPGFYWQDSNAKSSLPLTLCERGYFPYEPRVQHPLIQNVNPPHSELTLAILTFLKAQLHASCWYSYQSWAHGVWQKQGEPATPHLHSACLVFSTSYCGHLRKGRKAYFSGEKTALRRKQLLVLVCEIKQAKNFKEEKIVVGWETWIVFEQVRPSGILRINWPVLWLERLSELWTCLIKQTSS